ncbi:uncharacterized protein LOC100575167 [Acyrthosiphon pisum]|uniref:Uncharacterized protein n=1 Tax=Acyrthosiphon pisum TaxID=7029 RepID=A0A8R2D2L5_ACYPI|nr:uncharacterized protein LOC100575167 [Acyrthosiphon pisum]XP_016658450.1 uncharacterized protein LOC100575167 [Acyrthosiphon pisum]XP_016658452.1 uncharacterized protein LOC100575167 [Acyrthosiphon pisum]XP_016658457.1 uncharacterized protein LOC100575167 [Acyrthosiphon pisum]|eukprot:XP_016658449.1 PREDICTED: uncharacterized protein LOC100575167 [Acyrthosiphon pisum]
MAGYSGNLSDAMGALSVANDHSIELGLDNNIQAQLKKIKNNFESVFSWDILQLSEFNQNIMFNIIDKVQENLEMIIIDGKDNEFNFSGFYLQLIAIYEHYMSKRYMESYLGIETIVTFMETCKFDESNQQYSDAYHHIARATKAYIASTLKIDSKKLLIDVKPINNFNEAEKSSICAVKASIFMYYPPNGNDIALELANRACALHSTEPEWIIIWLKVKKRVRHRDEPYKIPGDDEIDAALYLYDTQSKPELLIQAHQTFKETGFINKINYNNKKSQHFYKLSSDIAKKTIDLVKKNTNKQNSVLLMHCLHYPKYLLSQEFIDNIITKLTNVKNSYVHLTIGRYYLDREKDFVKAKMYLSHANTFGNFPSSLQLIKVECLLQPVHTFPYVQTLNDLYNVYQKPNTRVIILIHILVYYNYCENNPKEMMHYLKLYIDQDISDIFKKRQLTFFRPLFNVGRFLKPNDFLNDLSANVKELINNNKWNEEEKKIIENTFDRSNKILQLNIQDNNFDDDNNL